MVTSKSAEKNDPFQPSVIVVGGGLAGLAFTVLCAQQDVPVLCLDRVDLQTQMQATFDGRTTAISFGSRQILEKAGVWEAIARQSCPIETIHISDGPSPVLLEFASDEVDGRAFGWIAENLFIRQCLLQKIQDLPQARYKAPAAVADFSRAQDHICVHLESGESYKAPLVVGADGRQSFTRTWADIGTRGWLYNQRAIVCTVTHEHPHQNVALENFRPEGPFAILPMTDAEDGSHRSSVVWTQHGPEEKSALHYEETVFNEGLTARFPDRLGAVKLAGRRFSYPLGLIHAHRYTAPRIALIADAAHGIHPIAGQGLNLGFRDIGALAELVVRAVQKGEDPGGEKLLEIYQRQRRFDNMAMAGTTDSLNKLFSNNIMPVRIGRQTGLKLVSRMPFAKQFFMKQAMGLSGLLPSMIDETKAA